MARRTRGSPGPNGIGVNQKSMIQLWPFKPFPRIDVQPLAHTVESF